MNALKSTIALLILCPFVRAETATSEREVEKTIVISSNDLMKYDVVAFEVKTGSKVKITLKNIGKLPKIAMGHNLVLLKSGVTAVAFGQKALAAGAGPTNPVPNGVKGDVIANTKLLGPDESDSIIITAPAPGKYEYVCTFPGHFALMRGTMTVK